MSVKEIKTKGEFDTTIASAAGLVMVDFTAEWCGPCRTMKPVLEEFAKEFTDVTFLKVDVDNNSETAEAENISAMPTFIFYRNGQRLKEEFIGANKEKLKALIEKHLSEN